jgi:hypothetical protein
MKSFILNLLLLSTVSFAKTIETSALYQFTSKGVIIRSIEIKLNDSTLENYDAERQIRDYLKYILNKKNKKGIIVFSISTNDSGKINNVEFKNDFSKKIFKNEKELKNDTINLISFQNCDITFHLVNGIDLDKTNIANDENKEIENNFNHKYRWIAIIIGTVSFIYFANKLFNMHS